MSAIKGESRKSFAQVGKEKEYLERRETSKREDVVFTLKNAIMK